MAQIEYCLHSHKPLLGLEEYSFDPYVINIKVSSNKLYVHTIPFSIYSHKYHTIWCCPSSITFASPWLRTAAEAMQTKIKWTCLENLTVLSMLGYHIPVGLTPCHVSWWGRGHCTSAFDRTWESITLFMRWELLSIKDLTAFASNRSSSIQAAYCSDPPHNFQTTISYLQ